MYILVSLVVYTFLCLIKDLLEEDVVQDGGVRSYAEPLLREITVTSKNHLKENKVFRLFSRGIW